MKIPYVSEAVTTQNVLSTRQSSSRLVSQRYSDFFIILFQLNCWLRLNSLDSRLQVEGLLGLCAVWRKHMWRIKEAGKGNEMSEYGTHLRTIYVGRYLVGRTRHIGTYIGMEFWTDCVNHLIFRSSVETSHHTPPGTAFRCLQLKHALSWPLDISQLLPARRISSITF